MTTNNGWNAPYLSTKGDIYSGAGGGARPLVVPIGTDGQVLTADSAETSGVKWETSTSLPGFSKIVTTAFFSSGTYTPTEGMSYCIVECVGGGGGGGGAATIADQNLGGAGGAGGYARKTLDAAAVGGSEAITIGVGGAAGSAGDNSGGDGGTTSFGSILSASGGIGGGPGGDRPDTSYYVIGGLGGVGSSGDFNANGGSGQASWAGFFPDVFGISVGGNGGDSIYGAGGVGNIAAGTASITGSDGKVYGGGASGGIVGQGGASAGGGSGSQGLVIVTEYIASGTLLSGVFSTNIQQFTNSGTYTPTTGLSYAIVEVQAGGGGGGNGEGNTGVAGIGGGGGAGGYVRQLLAASGIGGSQTITIGAGGTAGVAGENSTFGALITAVGGDLGPNSNNSFANVGGGAGGSGSVAAGIAVIVTGGPGTNGTGIGVTPSLAIGGNGGASYFGSGGAGALFATATSGNGNASSSSAFGSGGGGGVAVNEASTGNASSGTSGIIIVTEYIIS